MAASFVVRTAARKAAGPSLEGRGWDDPGMPNDAEPAQESLATLTDRLRTASRQATRWLPGRAVASPADELRSLAAWCEGGDSGVEFDRYGEGGVLTDLEAEVARLLGKPAAAVFPSGVLAQQAALRVWSDRRASRRIALPALSHLLHHELDGPRLVHGFEYDLLGSGEGGLPTYDEIAALAGRLGAVLLELPLRDAGYLLPTYDELDRISTWCRDREVPLHLDGARLWESTPALGRDLADVAGLFDTVYVSFYKGLGGLAGAALAGPADVVAEAVSWRKRMGGTLVTLTPYAVSALRGLREELPRMPAYVRHAGTLAEQLAGAGFAVRPQPPHTNAFRLLAPVAAEEVMRRLLAYTEAERTALTPPWRPADVPGWSWTEVTVGPATLEWTVDEAVEVLSKVLLG